MKNETMQEAKVQFIIEQIENMTSDELVCLNNTYCQEAGYSDGEIYENDEDFFDTFFSNRPMEVARSTFYGAYNFSHDFVTFNGYGNLVSYQSITTDELCESVSNIAEYIAENEDNFTHVIDFTQFEETE